MSPQAPETPYSCSFSKHHQCIHTLVTQVSSCLAPESWELWCQSPSLGQQRRDAVQTEDTTSPSPHRATTWSSGLEASSPHLSGACSPEMLWHIFFALVSNPHSPSHADAHTAVYPTYCTCMLLQQSSSPSPLLNLPGLFLSPSLSSFFWLGADS